MTTVRQLQARQEARGPTLADADDLPESLREIVRGWILQADRAEETRTTCSRAATIREMAGDLRRVLAWWQDPIPVPEAAAWSGYTKAHLWRLIREGKLRHTDRPGEPMKVRRCDLPRTPVPPGEDRESRA